MDSIHPRLRPYTSVAEVEERKSSIAWYRAHVHALSLSYLLLGSDYYCFNPAFRQEYESAALHKAFHMESEPPALAEALHNLSQRVHHELEDSVLYLHLPSTTEPLMDWSAFEIQEYGHRIAELSRDMKKLEADFKARETEEIFADLSVTEQAQERKAWLRCNPYVRARIAEGLLINDPEEIHNHVSTVATAFMKGDDDGTHRLVDICLVPANDDDDDDGPVDGEDDAGDSTADGSNDESEDNSEDADDESSDDGDNGSSDDESCHCSHCCHSSEDSSGDNNSDDGDDGSSGDESCHCCHSHDDSDVQMADSEPYHGCDSVVGTELPDYTFFTEANFDRCNSPQMSCSGTDEEDMMFPLHAKRQFEDSSDSDIHVRHVRRRRGDSSFPNRHRN